MSSCGPTYVHVYAQLGTASVLKRSAPGWE